MEEPQEPLQTFQHRRPWHPLYPGLSRLTWDQQGFNQELYCGPCGLLHQHCLLHGRNAQNTSSLGTGLPAPDGLPKSQEPETSPGVGDPTSKTQELEKQKPLLLFLLCHLISGYQKLDSGPCGLPPEDCLLHGPSSQNTSSGSTELPTRTQHPSPQSQRRPGARSQRRLQGGGCCPEAWPMLALQTT